MMWNAVTKVVVMAATVSHLQMQTGLWMHVYPKWRVCQLVHGRKKKLYIYFNANLNVSILPGELKAPDPV